MKYVIGLGNPIDENYSGTRHNIGFDVLFHMVPQDQFEYDKYASSLRAKTTISGEEVEILLPQLYMNNSGAVILSVEGLTDAFLEGDVLVVHDEIVLSKNIKTE